MFGWSPPNILVTLILCFLIVLQFYRSPTQAKPYQKRDSLGTYTAGTHRGVYKGDWPKIVNFENGEEKERLRRSPTEVDDESQDVTLGRTLSVVAQKRQGIETPIQPLTSDSSMDLQHLNMEENVRSKVNQPQNKSISVDVKTEQENKAAGESGKEDNVSTSQSELNVGNKYEISSSSAENANDPKAKQGIMDSNVALEAHDKADSSKLSVNYDSNSEKETSKGKMEVILVPSRSVDENAHVRSVEESTNNHLGNLPSDKSDKGEDNQPSSESPSITTKQPKAQTTNTVLVDKQHQDSDVNKGTIAKSETSGIISSNEKPVAPNEPSSSQKAHLKNDESKPINSTPQTDTASAEPVRDELGNSGSEIVTTHRRREPEVDSYAERDTEAKPANGPEVGHFQVDDKSADLEINANSAGVKVKAKPASLQVVSRPGSHSSSGTQERSFFSHYHYPPYHLHHHWYPGMRRSYGHLHRHHFFRPYRPFPERRSFESFYDEAPFYRRRLPYWYPHRRRHHFHDSYLYERSRLEEPDDLSRYRRRRRHKRRFRHINRPYRRQFYNNNIPIMNGMDVPPMGVQPEEGTMPQLPIGPVAPYTQRQNIVTPMPPPINVVGNPPPGLLGGVNAAMFGMNGMDNFNGINSMNREFNGMNAMGAFGFNLPDQMGPKEGFSNEITRGLGEIQRPHMTPGIATPISFSNTPVKASRRAFKKTDILSEKANNDTRKEGQSHDHKTKAVDKATKDILKTNLDNNFRKTKINIKSWEKTLKHYHSLKTPTSKIQEPHKFRRNTKSAFESTEKKNTGKMITTHLHPQHAKEMEGKRKNEIVMHRPPIIYHPPPEIYHRPDIVVHRAPIMLHRPPIIYHQPPVVVHRPAIIYHQPPIVFHQPPPMVHQPILHSHDTWVAKPVVYHTASTVSHDKTYFGVPSHVYAGNYGAGCHKGVCFYRKGRVPHSKNTNAKNSTLSQKTKRDSLSDYMDYVSSLWKPNEVIKRNIHDDYELITSRDGAKQKLSYKDTSVGNINKRDRNTDDRSFHFKRDSDDLKNTSEKKKKKDVVVNRPPIIYHPPPEIYHRPDIVVHRPPLVIHRPPIIYHQPPVIVHRPAVVYHQPPIVFHQPPPAVSQPLLYSHDSFTVHPTFYATHHGSVVRDFGHYVGVPNVITNYGNPLFGRGPPMGKRSKIEKPPSNKNGTSLESANSTEAASKKNTLKHRDKKAKNESNEKAGKKNTVLVHRPPIIYHPPPEIYHRPVIVVHRPPIMIHRAPIFYHQPPVVVHRPAIVYHQPPLIFHQPPPMVHQPILKSHDTWISHPVVFPYASRVMHHHTYVGVPDAYTVRHYGDHGFYKSHILKHTHHDEGHAFERNKITGEKKHSKNQKEDSPKEQSTSMESENQNTSLSLKTKNVATQKGGKKNTVIVRRPPVIYHPPPEIYHRPEIVVHRAPIVIHRAPIIYHQPPVVVHRPAIVYHEPPLIFHQPPPVVHQRIYKSHDAYIRRPVMKLFSSRMHRAGHLYHIPHAYYHGRGGAIHFMAFGKSKVPQKEHFHEEKGDTRTTVNESKTSKTQRRSHHKHRKHSTLTRSKDKTETGTKLHHNYKFLYHKAEEVTEKAHKKNSVVIHRPPIIYHPPPEIYHRPDIVVHRAPIVLYRAPIIYHQPPVVVHRPAIVYHQPAIVFHQPPPMVNQPVLHSHDTWVSKAVVIPYGSRVRHIATYRGVPHEGIFMHGFGTGAFGKSRVPIRGSRRNEIHGINVKGSNGTSETKTEESKESREQSDKERNRLTRVSRHGKKRKEYKTIHAAAIMKKTLPDRPSPEYMKNLVGTRARSPRSLQNLIGGFNHPVSSAAFLRDLNNIKSDVGASAEMRIQSAISDHQGPVGANVRIQRGIAETWNKFEETKPERSSTEEGKHKNSRRDKHKKKKDVVVNRPPIIYHPPPEVYHRPDIVVHRAPILIHRPPIVYHQPPVVVHRPAVVYHQPPIVFHQPAPAVNQPLLFSHDSFVVHPMAFASHMGSVVNDAGRYIGLPHGGVTNYPGSIPHGITGHVFPSLNPHSWSRRAEVSKPKQKKNEKVTHEKHDKLKRGSAQINDNKNGKGLQTSSWQKSKQTKGERKNKVIVARPAMIYHPPPEIYDRPDIIVHRPDIVIHQPSVVYHQSSVVVHRAPVIYQQPPVVFHQPAPMITQPVYHAHDTYIAQHVYHPHESHISHSATYVGAPHYYPGHNSYGWGLPGNEPNAHVHPAAQFPEYGYLNSPAYPTQYLVPRAYVRSKVENAKKKFKHKDAKSKNGHMIIRRRSAVLSKHHRHRHHHHYHHDHDHDHHHHHRVITDYDPHPVTSIAHIGHRKHTIIIHRPPLIYYPPPRVYNQPDIVMHQPLLVYHKPSIVLDQPPTVVHHPKIVYHQPSVVFHDPQPIVHTPVINTPLLVKSHMERVNTKIVSSKPVSGKDSDLKGAEKPKSDEKRDLSNPPQRKKRKERNGSKKQNVVVHRPPIVYHPPPNIFHKPPVVMHQPPTVVYRPPILIHRAPVVVQSPPMVIHRPPIVLYQPEPTYHTTWGYAFGKSKLEGENNKQSKAKHSDKKQGEKKSRTKGTRRSKSTKADRKNMVLVHRPAMIYHPPPEIYDRPDVIVHRPDIVIHRPSIVYHQPSVVVHRSPIIYRQPPVVFHQPSPMVHQPVMHAHDMYVAHAVPVPHTSHLHHTATYVGAPHFFNEPHINGYFGHAFAKSKVTKISNNDSNDVNNTRTTSTILSEDERHFPLTPGAPSKDLGRKKSKPGLKGHLKAGKKNQVIINRPALIYHPPPEIYDRPNVIVHRPDIVVHRPSIVFHQPSVVVHRPPIIYQAPSVVFHQPPPLVNQPIMHSYDTYVAHAVPVPYSSHIQHTSTYVGSPHHYPGAWNYGWSQPHAHDFAWDQFNPFGLAYGKSNIPSNEAKVSHHRKSGRKDKIRRTLKDQSKREKKKDKTLSNSRKKNQVVFQRPPLIYHPPPEVYHKPDVIVHRPDVVIHRPAVVYHQPSVVIHRPPVIYHQPPVVFHQPAPSVSQPILHSHDTYVNHPYFTQASSSLYHIGNYIGSPHFYSGGLGEHGYGTAHAFGKSEVQMSQKKGNHHKNMNIQRKGLGTTPGKDTKDLDDKPKFKKRSKKVTYGIKKNLVVMRRPPLIYHPPPEIYHKPDVVVHRPDLVIHRPSVVFHQPSVVVHRPPVIYRPPPVIFHQPSPMVQQPILHSHDTYLASTHFDPFIAHVYHTGSYVGAPHYYPGGWGHGYGAHKAFGKSKVEKRAKKQKKIESHGDKNENYRGKNKRSVPMEKYSFDLKKRKHKKKDASRGDKKNVVIIRRPPLVYHPPPEIYHKPVVIVHRPDIVLHRPSVVFHQPSVVVHRAPVIYRQPPVVFHQPSPMVNQPIYHSHETYLAHHHFVPYLSHLTHAGSYVGVPHFFPGHQSMGHFFGHAYGKSKVEPSLKTSQGKSESLGDKNNNYRGKNKRSLSMEKDSSESKKRKLKIKAASGGDKKNVVIIRRPPLVYHPPPEIYHKPVVIVHRPDIVLHRPSVVFHQPSVVVHRAPVIYRQPPVVFHQPSPMVNQPIYHSHETYLAHHRFVPYLSHLTHAGSYVGVPHFFPGHQSMGHFFGHAYGKSKVEPSLKTSQGKTTKPSKKSEGTEKQAAMHEDLYRKLRKQVKKTKSGKGRKKTVQLHPEKENKKDHHRVHRKNMVLVQRPALIYHPPPEIYARPNIIVHRPDVVIHRPSVVYHQPSVVVHRPPIIYHQPPVIFHQPAPMVKQPIYTSHDIYQSHPQFVPYVSHINHAETYVGAPHYFPGEWKYGYGFSDSFVPRDVGFHQWNGFTSPMSQLSPYRADYFLSNSLGKPSGVRSRQGTAFAKSDVQKYHEKAKDIRNNTVIRSKYNERKKSKESDKKDRKRSRRSAHLPKSLRKRVNETRKVSKKNMVIIRRPPLVYHPPPEVYHKPDVIVHRPDVVIHRPSVVYHQPSVVVHRPPIIYNEPPVIFHQPAPMVNQAIFHSHEHYIAHPSFVPFTSHLYHTSTYVGAPEFLHAQGTSLYGHAIGKSDVAKNKSKTRNANHKTENKNKIRRLAKEKSTKSEVFHPQKEKDEKASRKNDIVVSRPPIIYHPPPEIYHRPDIVVHRAPIVLHRPPIIYHQPPVVVHRPAVVYHQPPVVFHQPPPTVHQPILHSHDSFVVHPNAKFFPQGSTLTHSMNYVGIPNHVLHTDDTAFHVFHRSNIEYSDKETSHKTTQKRKTPVPKSTISKIPTTNKENTQTTITDQTQKKTLRSIIRRHRLNKRQLIGSHSLFGSFSPINNIDNSRTSVEQNHKLSTIPGDVSNLEKNTAKRQLILQEPTENVLHNTLPPVYDTLEMAALQNQALRATEDLQELNSANRVTLPFSGNSLERAAIRQYPVPLQSYLQSTPKHYSPDVRVHVETTRSSIPRNSRNKRQIVPLYQQQYTTQMHPLVLQAPNTQNTEDTTSAFSSSSLYHLFSPYHLAYHQLTNPYHYLGINAVQHHPRVNINVQSARSTIPKGDHFIQKRSEEKKSKRQFLAVMSPLSPKMPFGLRSGMMPLPISPYYSLQRYPLPLVPSLDDSEESEMEEPTFPETLPIFRGQSQDIFNPYNALQDDENYSPSINFMASYLRSLYNSYLGYPPNQHGRKPKVDIEVHATKSDIPKVTEDTKYFHARIAKRQMSDFLPNSRLISNHHNLSAANGPKSYHHSSLHVSNSVETAKKHDMIAVIKERRFPEARKRKQFQQTRTGDKRDELLQNSENGQGISPYQGNANFMATQANEFVGTSESSPLQNDIDPGNNEGIQTPSQQQDVLETDGQQQEAQSQEQLQEQEQDQQQSPTQQPPNIPDQPTIEPFQQQLVLPAPLAPIQLPIQPPLQPAFNLPLVAPVQSDAQGALPGISRAKSTEQSSSQQGSDADEWQPKHTTIDIKVGAKSIVPQTSTKTKKSSLQEYFPQTMDEKKDNQRRERISLLTRFPAMQVLPQTFKQNGVMMPPFNTLPVNHRVKSNGMLLEELQKQKKYQILRAKMNKGHKKLKENAKKREFFAIPQSTLPAQPYLFPAQAKAQSRPKVSVTVKVNHRKSTFPTEKYLSQQKGESGLHDQNEKPKRQVYGMEPYTNPFLKSPQVPQVQMNAQQPKVSIQVEAEKKRTIRQQGNKGNQSTKERRQIYGLSELPQGGIMQPVSLTSQTRPLGYFPTSLHTPRVSINVVTSKRSKEDFHDIHKRQMLGFQSDVVETMGGHQETIPPSQAPFMDNEVAEYNTAQTPDNVQTQSSEDEASQTTIQSNPAILQQQQVPVLSSNENDFNERPRVTVHVEASKRDSKANKEGHHISPGLSKGKVSEHREGANGYGPPKKLKRQLFGTVPLFSSLDQTGISADLQDGSNARSSVPISAGNTGYTSHRIQKRQFYNYLGGQQEGTLSDQAIKDTNEAQQQQQQGIPIGVFQQEPGLQTEVPQMNPQQGSLLPENNQYQNQIDLPENNQLKGLFGPLSTLNRPRVSINVQTTKSQVPITVATKRNTPEKEVSKTLDKESKKFKRQFEIIGGGGVIERRRGSKLLTSPSLKKGRGGNLLGFGTNLNKPVEVFADPITNLVAGGLPARKRPRLGGIRIDSPPGLGTIPLKGSVNPIEGTLAPGQGVPSIIQDNAAEEIAPFVQDAATTSSNPLLPPNGIAAPAVESLGKENIADMPLPDTPAERTEIVPVSNLNQALVQNFPLESASAPLPERQVLLTPQVLPMAPIVPLAPPMLVPPAATMPSLTATDQNGPENLNSPLLRPVFPPIFPMAPPIAAPPSPPPSPTGVLPESEEDKPSVHVNVETARSHVPRVKHSKAKTSDQAGRG